MIVQSEIFQNGSEIAWEDLGNGISRKMYGFDQQLMLVKVKFEANAVGVMHQHHHSQATYVESGKFELTIGEHTKVIKQGDGYCVPPNTIHGCVCLEPGVLLDVFSPHREDFLK